MVYSIRPSRFFLKQFEKLSNEANRVLTEKIESAKTNPFRYKSVRMLGHTFFRIRFTDRNCSKRLIYHVDKNDLILLFILDRGNEYKNLKKYLRNLGY